MKSILITFAFMATAAVIRPTPACAEPVYPHLTSHVVDAAHAIPEKDALAMSEELEGIDRATGHQFAVAIVPSLEDEDVNSYAVGLHRYWRLGRRGVDDGLLLLWAPKEHKVYFSVGPALQPTLTDAAASGIARDVIVPLFKKGDFVGGLEAGIHAAVPLITPDTPERAAERRRQESRASMDRAETSRKIGGFFFALFLAVLAAAGAFGAWLLATIPKRRRERQERADAKLAATEADRRRRLADEKREREFEAEQEALRQKKIREREEMLARETPAERAAREAGEAALAAAAAERQRQRAEQDAQEARERQERRARDDAAAAAAAAAAPTFTPTPTPSWDYTPTPSPSPTPDYSPAPDFGMGGSTDGGGGGASY